MVVPRQQQPLLSLIFSENPAYMFIRDSRVCLQKHSLNGKRKRVHYYKNVKWHFQISNYICLVEM